MIRPVMTGLAAAALMIGMAGVSRADDKSDVQAAVKKLSDAASYSWTATVEVANEGFGAGKTDGKIEKDGYASFETTSQQGTVPIVIKGDKAAAKMDSGWMTKAELQKAGEDAGGFSPETFMLFRIAAFKAPAVQAKEIADKMENVKKTADGYTADLPEAAAKELLAFKPPAGSNFPESVVKSAKASVKFWVKDGVISKMQLHQTGSQSFGDQDFDVDRTTTTEIKDVGTTKVAVADDAKKKIEAK